ncbi:MAG TPA: GNAT family N-acetyltransferase [Segeticoccus sp.]|nr:GNAT family N-acetyltransferase [Segeticoccus sp.]
MSDQVEADVVRHRQGSVTIRSVTRETPGDRERFVELWTAFRVEQGAARAAVLRDRDERVDTALAQDGVTVFLAESAGEAVGYVALLENPLTALSESSSIWVDQLYVAPHARRNGTAKALLAAATRLAEDRGAEQVGACVPAQARETNRFFARLGFHSFVVRRVTSTPALRRRLGAPDERSALEELLQRRRSLRARAGRSARQLVGS